MSATFKLGEIALYAADPANTPNARDLVYSGRECIVESKLGFHRFFWRDAGGQRRRSVWGIIIRMFDGQQIAVLPHELRKRKPAPSAGEQAVRAMFDASRQPAREIA